MYREGIECNLQDILLDDQLLFEFSPAESLINFDLPSSFCNESNGSWQLGNFCSDDSDTAARDTKQSSVSATECSDLSDLFDFTDWDRTLEFDDCFLEALSSDYSVTAPESPPSDDIAVIGSTIDELRVDLNTKPNRRSSTSWRRSDKPKGIAMPARVECGPRSKPGPDRPDRLEWGEPRYYPDVGAFRCPVEDCGKLYAKASHVRAHLRRHSGEKPYHCTWAGCSWRFARSDELARHRRSHSGDKPYRCGECGKCFARSDHLAKHGRVHARRRAAATALATTARRSATASRRRLL